APAHQVHHGGILGAGGALAGERPLGVGEGEHAAAAGGVDPALEVRGRQGLAVAVAVGEADEEGAAGGGGGGQREGGGERAGPRRVPQAPAVDVDVGVGG